MTTDRAITANLSGHGIQNCGAITVGGNVNIGTRHFDTNPERLDGPQYRDRQRTEFLRRLRTSPYEERKNRNPPRAEGTCEWFASHELFGNWQEQASALLWVSADPGCGKSVLARYLVDDVFTSNATRTTCYFFFKDDFEDQKALEGAFCCLLHQLFVQKPALLSDEILRDFEEEGQHFFASFPKLWDLFVTTASHHKDGEIICVLDALDECADHTHLTTALTQLYSKGKGAPTLKFLVTSRPYLRIQRNFEGLKTSRPTIHLSGESQEEVDKIAQEITAVISQRIEELCKRLQLDSTEKQILQTELAAVEHRTYLWIHLVFADMEEAVFLTKHDLRHSLRDLPHTVEEAYDKILRKSHDFVKARKILHIVVAAERPLSLTEMAAALAFRDSHRCHADLEQELLPPDRLHIAIREACGLFVVIKNSQVFLLHQTAKEFLVRSPSMPSEVRSPSLEWQHSLDLGDSHRLISDICMRYLLLADFRKPGSARSPKLNYGHDFIFLDYATSNWAYHYRQAHNTCGTDLEPLALELCRPTSPFCLNWLKARWVKHQHSLYPHPDELHTSLLVASYSGLDSLVNIILGENKDSISARGPYTQRTALTWASEKGYHLIVKSLLDRVPKHQVSLRDWSPSPTIVNRVDKFGRTPLWHAAANGHQNTVRDLLRRGAKVDTSDVNDLTPLSWAAQNGHSDVVALLLEWGAQQHTKTNHLERIDQLGRTPLIKAVRSRNEFAVQMLLDRGAQVDRPNKHGDTALMLASRIGQVAVVKLLLDRGAQVDRPNKYGDTALILASTYGYDATAKVLLDHGANIDARTTDSRTALIRASLSGNTAVIKLLLERGAQVNASCIHGRTALIQASERDHDAAVKVLLDHGANVNARTTHGQTALILASFRCYYAVVKRLLDYGAEVGRPDDSGMTPLITASAQGCNALVDLLLDYGAEIDTPDVSSRTALWFASCQGHDTIVKLLLDRGAKVNACNLNGKTALKTALDRGHDAVVKLLANHGAKE